MKAQYRIIVQLFVLLFISAGILFGQKPAEKLAISSVKIEKEIELTGKLDDPSWALAKPVELNYEFSPNDNTFAQEKTLVKSLYNDKYLYFGFECFDSNPEQIRANITDRDNIFMDDFVSVCIDTYGDFQRYVEFVLNPYGIKGDILTAGDNEDSSIDLIWHGEASINGAGWSAVLAIPFSSLNFTEKEEYTWTLALTRCIPRANRTMISWTRIDRNIPGFITQAGELKGLKNIKPGGNIELLPYVMGQKSGMISDFSNPVSGMKFDPITGRFGGGIKYSPSPNFTLDAVLNPDFSQIESDADQISVNTTFALQYDERRPFFLTGRELLQTPMYYSRSINDPLYAGRIMGKTGSLTYMYMGAYDRNTVFVVPGEEGSNTVATNMKSYAGIGRMRYDFGNENYIGGMFFSRNMDEGHNYLLGFDWNYRFWTNWSFTGESFYSMTKEMNNKELFNSQRRFGNSEYTAGFDGQEYTGAGIHLSLSHSQKYYGFGITYNHFTPTYQTYNGAFTQTGYKQLYTSQQLRFYPENSFIVTGSFGLATNLRFDFEGARKELVVQPILNLTLKGQTSVYLSYLLVNDELFINKHFEGVNRGIFSIQSRPIKEITLIAEGQIGEFIYRSSNPVLGSGHNLSVSMQLNPTARLKISVSYTRARLTSKETDNIFYDGNIYRTTAIYQFTPEIFLRTILQYNSFNKSFQLYPLFSYKLNAFTTFFAGATSSYLNYEGDNGFVNTDQQYFVKLQYLLGL